jgi:MoaA/NifB/PqqE/SkfB family radical SAM enzyme
MISATGLLRQLRFKRLLAERLRWLGIRDDRTLQWLVDLDRAGTVGAAPTQSENALHVLSEYELIEIGPRNQRRTGCRQTIPLPFVEAVNFELTYDCNMRCSHCLQASIRGLAESGWIATDSACKAIVDAWFAGLLTTGVNLTGGEVFLPESNLPEILETAMSLHLAVRVNTNGFWGGKTNIQIGDLLFGESREVIEWLKEHGVEIMATSFDHRYIDQPKTWEAVKSLIEECRSAGLPVQLVSARSYVDRQNVKDVELAAFAGSISHTDMAFVPMDLVDIGGNFESETPMLQTSSLCTFPGLSDCGGLGYTKPSILHIAPHGGVRTCMYAPGSAPLGNINESSMLRIVNTFLDNPVFALYGSTDLQDFVDTYFRPYVNIYRHVRHPCANSALLARFAEMLHGAKAAAGGVPIEVVRGIHERIALEYGLGRAEAASINQTSCWR